MKGSIGLIIVTVIVLLIGGLFAFNFGDEARSGFLSGPHESSPRSSTLSNVKQYNIALLMYCADYDDKYPVQMGDEVAVQAVVSPYVKNPSIFRTLNFNGGIISSNGNLAGVPSVEVIDPGVSPMLYETNDWPEGDRVIGYSDGHAMFITGFDTTSDLEVDLSTIGEQAYEDTKIEIEGTPGTSQSTESDSLGSPGK